MSKKLLFLPFALTVYASQGYAASFTYQHLVTCLMRDNVCETYKPTQGPIIDNGAKPWFYPEQGKDYGEVHKGSSKIQTFLVANIGTGPLTVYGFDKGLLSDSDMSKRLEGFEYVPNAFRFAKSDCPMDSSFVLGVSATCTLSVRYVPSELQKQGDVIKMLHSSAELGPIVQDITGTGIPPIQLPTNNTTPTTGGEVKSPPPNPDVTPKETKDALQFSSKLLDFGEVEKNSTVPSLSVVLTNLLDKDLNFKSKVVSAGLYKFTDNCSPTLVAKSSCTFNVTIDTSKVTKPASSDSLQVQFKEGASGSVSLTGIVKGVFIQSSPNPAQVEGIGLDVDNSGEIVLTNTGTTSTSLTNFTISDSPEGDSLKDLGGFLPVESDNIVESLGGFNDTPPQSALLKIIANKCAKLSPNTNCVLTLNIKSASEVQTSKYLNFDVDGKRYSVEIKSKVKEADLKVEPALSDWGLVPFYSSQEKTLTITNISDKKVEGISIQTPPAFSVKSKTCETSLAVGASCQYTLAFTPTEFMTSNTIKKGNIINAGDVSSIPFELKGAGTGPLLLSNSKMLNFGKVNPQTGYPIKSIRLTNMGNETAHVHKISLEKENFTISSHTCGTAIVPGAFCDVNIQLSTASNGLATNTLRIETNSTKEANLSVDIKADVNGAVLVASPEKIVFTNVKYGSAPEETSIITNKGNMPLTLTDIVPYGYYMSIISTCKTGIVLKPNDTCSATFKMNTSVGARDGASGSLSIASDTAKATLTVSAVGTTYGSYMDVPENVKAPLTKVGNYSYARVNIYNSAYQPFTITQASLDSTTPHATQWSELTHNCVNIQFGRGCQMLVKFTPDSFGIKEGKILFSSTDDRYPTGSIKLQGEGIDGDIAFYIDDVLTKNFNLGKTPYNQIITKKIKMVNVGVQTTKILSAGISPEWTVEGCTGQILEPNTYCEFKLSSSMPYQSISSEKVYSTNLTFSFDKALKAVFPITYIPHGAWPLTEKTVKFTGTTPYQVSKTYNLRLYNHGNNPLNVLSYEVENDPYQELAIDYSACKNIRGAAEGYYYCNVVITYTSKKEGPLAATLKLQTNSNSQVYSTTKGEVAVAITASSAAGVPKVSFDNSAAVPSKIRQIYLANKGSSGFTIQSMSVENISGTVSITNTGGCQAISAGNHCILTATVSGNQIKANLKLNITGAAGDDGKGNVSLPLEINPEVTTLMSNEYLDPVGFYLTSTLWYKAANWHNSSYSGPTLALADGDLSTYVETRAAQHSYFYADYGVNLDAPELQHTSKVNMFVENINDAPVLLRLGRDVGNWFNGDRIATGTPVELPAYFKGYVSIPVDLYFYKDYLTGWYIVAYQDICVSCNSKYRYKPIRVYEARVIK